MAIKKKRYRGISVGNDAYISLCETCKHMPVGTVPRKNKEVQDKSPKQP